VRELLRIRDRWLFYFIALFSLVKKSSITTPLHRNILEHKNSYLAGYSFIYITRSLILTILHLQYNRGSVSVLAAKWAATPRNKKHPSLVELQTQDLQQVARNVSTTLTIEMWAIPVEFKKEYPDISGRVNATPSTLQKMLYAWAAATHPTRSNRTSLKTIRSHNQEDLDLWLWIKKVRNVMESIIHGFFDSPDSTASPFTHLDTQDREKKSTVAFHRFNQVFEKKLFTNLDPQHKL
jgi:hypothetical protein